VACLLGVAPGRCGQPLGIDRPFLPALAALGQRAQQDRHEHVLGLVAVGSVAPVDTHQSGQVALWSVGPHLLRHHPGEAQARHVVSLVLRDLAASWQSPGRAHGFGSCAFRPASAFSAARISAPHHHGVRVDTRPIEVGWLDLAGIERGVVQAEGPLLAGADTRTPTGA
jgi:hypothetical protein